MHQPLYKNGTTGEYEMPWTFLHAIKDYYDMPWHVSQFEGLKVCFNLTPVLIAQLKEYASGKAKCKFLRLMRKPVKELLPEEKNWLLRFLFHGNVETMVKPFKLYYEFFLKFEQEDQEDFIRNISNQDFLNIEVLFLLSWCGKYLRENSPTVKRLIDRESVFSEEEKLELLEELQKFTGKILPLYRALRTQKKIEITTTPYYHPILPLLLKIESARESAPSVRLPALHVNFTDDAELQVETAFRKSEEIFGKVEGVWPAEGGISEDSLILLRERGAKWCASDEEILFKSLDRRSGTREFLYRVYSFKGVKLLFRDRELSDLIGFVYKGWNENEAVNDFLQRLKKIESQFKTPVVSIILDGENCWEFYRDNGYPFRERLYRALTQESWIETTFPSELQPTETLGKVVAGSWIGGNFLTWVGEPEKNRAWELLGITKLNIEEAKEHPNYKEARERILTAEGSDWFWWFGKKHYSKFLEEFDKLFRSNLIGAYKLVDRSVPKELLFPINRSKISVSSSPRNYVEAVIDGEVTSYYEWLDAGRVNLLGFATMEKGNFIMKELFYGYDQQGNLFLRIDGNWEKLKGTHFEVILEFSEREEKKFTVKPTGEVEGCKSGRSALKRVLEVKLPSECLKGIMGRKSHLTVKLIVRGKLIEEAPFLSFALLDLSRNFSFEWMV